MPAEGLRDCRDQTSGAGSAVDDVGVLDEADLSVEGGTIHGERAGHVLDRPADATYEVVMPLICNFVSGGPRSGQNHSHKAGRRKIVEHVEHRSASNRSTTLAQIPHDVVGAWMPVESGERVEDRDTGPRRSQTCSSNPRS